MTASRKKMTFGEGTKKSPPQQEKESLGVKTTSKIDRRKGVHTVEAKAKPPC